MGVGSLYLAIFITPVTGAEIPVIAFFRIVGEEESITTAVGFAINETNIIDLWCSIELRITHATGSPEIVF